MEPVCALQGNAPWAVVHVHMHVSPCACMGNGMYMDRHMHVCMCVYAHVNVYVFMGVNVHAFVCMCVCVHECASMGVHLGMCKSVCACIHVCTCVSTYAALPLAGQHHITQRGVIGPILHTAHRESPAGQVRDPTAIPTPGRGHVTDEGCHQWEEHDA